MSIAKIVKKGKPYYLRRNINRYKSKIFGNKKRAAFYCRPSKHSDYRKVSLKIIRILLFNREFIYTLAEILFARTQHHTWEARLVGSENLYLNLLYFHCAANGSPGQQKLSPPTPTPVVKASPRCHHRRFPSFPGLSSPAGL